MKLTHAIQVADKTIATAALTAEERIAITVLVNMARRVLDTRAPLRTVLRAVYGEDLNQVEMDNLTQPPAAK